MPHTSALDFDANAPSLLHSVARANQKRLRAECQGPVAGYVPERKALRHYPISALIDAPDTHAALRCIRHVDGCDCGMAMLTIQWFYMPATIRLVRRPEIWRAIEAVAQALLAASTGALSATEVETLVAQHVKPVGPSYWT